jgi:hypothetical protein
LFLQRKHNHCQWRWAVLSFLQLWELVSYSRALFAQSLGKRTESLSDFHRFPNLS